MASGSDKKTSVSSENKKTSSSSSSSSKKRSVVKEGRLDHIIIRNLFVNSILRRMVLIAIFSLACAVLSIISAYQIVKVKTPPQYIQLTQDGRILPITPLNKPNVNNGEIINFAIESIKGINTYDYVNWKDQIQSNVDRFTPSGWKSFIASLVGSDNLVAVQERKLVVSSRLLDSPRIIKEGFIENVGYTWVVEAHTVIAYNIVEQAGNSVDYQRGTVRLYISRVPLDVSLRGYGISVYQLETSAATE